MLFLIKKKTQQAIFMFKILSYINQCQYLPLLHDSRTTTTYLGYIAPRYTTRIFLAALKYRVLAALQGRGSRKPNYAT